MRVILVEEGWLEERPWTCRDVGEGAVSHVHAELEVMQEVSPQDRLFDICHYKNPPKGSAQPKVEGKGANPKRSDLRTVDCLQVEIPSSMGTFSGRGRDNTHLSTGVDQESCITGGIVYVKETT